MASEHGCYCWNVDRHHHDDDKTSPSNDGAGHLAAEQSSS